MDTSYYIAARDELLNRLRDAFFQPVYRYFGNVWYTTSNNLRGEISDLSIENFRKKMNEVKGWTTTKIDEEYQNVTQGRESVFDLIVTRTFTINARILTFAADVPPAFITINIPDNRRFVHMVFINAAREFYLNPYIFIESNRTGQYQRITVMRECINEVIDKTIRELQSLDNIFNGSAGSVNHSGSVNSSVYGGQQPSRPPDSHIDPIFQPNAPPIEQFPYDTESIRTIPREEEPQHEDPPAAPVSTFDESESENEDLPSLPNTLDEQSVPVQVPAPAVQLSVTTNGYKDQSGAVVQ